MVMVFPHIAIVVNATPTGFCMDGSAALIPILHGLGRRPIGTILHGDDQHVLLGGRLKNQCNLSTT